MMTRPRFAETCSGHLLKLTHHELESVSSMIIMITIIVVIITIVVVVIIA